MHHYCRSRLVLAFQTTQKVPTLKVELHGNSRTLGMSQLALETLLRMRYLAEKNSPEGRQRARRPAHTCHCQVTQLN